MAISIRHNTVEEAARYLRLKPENIRWMMEHGEIEVLRLGGEDYVALDVISEGNGPRRYEPHRPNSTPAPRMPVSRSRPRRRR